MNVTDDDDDNFGTLNTQKRTTKAGNKSKAEELHHEIGGKIATTMTALQQYLTENCNNKKSDFSQTIDGLINCLSPENRSLAEAKIMEYLCKCQLVNLKNGDISNVQM